MSTQDEHVANLKIEFEVLIGNANQVLAEIQDRVDGNTKGWDKLSRTMSGVTRDFDNVTGKGTQVNTALKDQSTSLGQSSRELDKQSQSAKNLSDSALPRLRYALYDVSFAAAVAGAALLAGGVLVARTAIEYQSLYADVARTYEGIQGLDKGVQLDNLRGQLLQITSDLPVAFADVTKIATLGNQLGIPAAALKDFTETVAEFSATTNVSTEDAATAFGRLGQLLHTTDFKGLGDDIAYLGVNAVATESQIIGVAQQIAVSANAAGFSTKQTLALSTAMASLGVKPEAARGSILRTFSSINAAVNSGGAQLNDLAAISGKTSQEFASQWKTDASGAFTSFVGGLSKDTGAIKGNLGALGISAARDVQAVSLLAQNMDVLNQSQQDVGDSAGYLDQAFGVINDTVSSKLTKLGNNFQRLFDTIGAGANGPIGTVVDAIGGLVNLLNDIEKNPFTAWSTAAFLGLATLAGAGLLVFAALARIQGSMLAVATAGQAMNESGGTSSIIWDILTFKALRLTAANEGLAASNSAVAASEGAKGAASTEAAVATNASAAAGGKLSSILGKAGLIGAALALVAVAPAVVTAVRDWADEMSGASQSADELATKFELMSQNFSTMEGAKALQSTKDALGYLTNRPDTLYDDGTGARSYTGAQLAVNKVKTGSYTAGRDFNVFNGGASINSLGDSATKQVEAYDQAISDLIGAGKLDAANAALKVFHGVMQQGGVSTKDADAALVKTNASLDNTTGKSAAAAIALAAQAAGTDDAADAFQTYIDSAYEASNAQLQLSGDLDTLGQAFANNGADAAGNGKEIQSVISDIYATAGSPGEAASQMQGFFNALIDGGFATASQLSGLQAVIYQLTGGKGTSATSFDLSKFTGGFDTAQKAIQKTANSAANAAKVVRTLTDYASDLGTVFKRAFDIRYGGTQALDTISKGWATVRKNAADAADAMAKANATLQQLASDKSIDEYWLTVANMYGDTLRAADIQADLAKNAQDTSDAQKDLAEAQTNSSKTLVGNSDAAIQNRDTILGLVGNYEAYIQSLAASGADQATLQATSARLKQEFIQQATQLGFNSAELGTYASSFDDVALAIGRVPRNITVAANTNPALQALNELEAKARDLSSQSYAGPTIVDSESTKKYARGQALLAQISTAQANMNATNDVSAKRLYGQAIQFLSDKYASGNYYTGGYTGDGGKYEVKGNVHGGEFVFDQVATRNAGPANLAYAQEMLRSGKGFSLGGGTGGDGVIQLSQYDRQLLMDIRDRQGLSIAGTALSSVSSAENVNSSNRGAA